MTCAGLSRSNSALFRFVSDATAVAGKGYQDQSNLAHSFQLHALMTPFSAGPYPSKGSSLMVPRLRFVLLCGNILDCRLLLLRQVFRISVAEVWYSSVHLFLLQSNSMYPDALAILGRSRRRLLASLEYPEARKQIRLPGTTVVH